MLEPKASEARRVLDLSAREALLGVEGVRSVTIGRARPSELTVVGTAGWRSLVAAARATRADLKVKYSTTRRGDGDNTVARGTQSGGLAVSTHCSTASQAA